MTALPVVQTARQPNAQDRGSHRASVQHGPANEARNNMGVTTMWIEALDAVGWLEMPFARITRRTLALRLQQAIEYREGRPARVIY